MNWLLTLLLVALGVTVVILGGADDSPGLQGIGLLLVLGTVAWQVLRRRR